MLLLWKDSTFYNETIMHKIAAKANDTKILAAFENLDDKELQKLMKTPRSDGCTFIHSFAVNESTFVTEFFSQETRKVITLLI